MSSALNQTALKNTDRMIRLRTLISYEQYRSAVRAPGWSFLDRFLYRSMRSLLFNRELELVRTSAKRALLRTLEADEELSGGGLLYLQIEARIWALRFKSTAFALGANIDAASELSTLCNTSTNPADL